MKNPISLLRFSSWAKLPVILQTEAAECGLASIAMVACFHGFKTDMNWLRQRFSISLKGATLQHLMAIANGLNLSSRALKLELEDLKKLRKPCILHWDLNHFVVLKKVTNSKVVIHDPAFGEKSLTFSEVSLHFTGIALELQPNEHFRVQRNTIKMKITDFYSRIENLFQSLFYVFILSVLLQVFALASPYYMQLVVDKVMLSNDQNLLVVLAIGFGLLALIQLLTNALRSLVILHFGNLLNMQMAANLFHHLIRLPLAYFEKRHIGDVVSRFSSLNKVNDILTTGIIETIIDGLMGLATLVMIFLYSPMLSLIVVIAIILYAVVRACLYRPLRQLSEEAIVAKAKEQSNFMESVRGIQTIKLFGKEAHRQGIWQNTFSDEINCQIKLGKYRIHFSWLNELIFAVENVLVIYFAALLVMSGQLTVGMLFAFMSYKRQFIEKMVNLIEKLIEFKMLSLHLDRLADIALTKTENMSEVTPMSPTTKLISGKIEIKDLAFQYEKNDPFVFKNFNLAIEAGESVAIIGPSGCGKTTLLKTMLALFTPTSGKILIDGVDLPQIGVNTFRSQVATVMQDDQVLTGSISDNIAFFSDNVDLLKVQKVAQLSGLDNDINAMSMGYNTLVGDMGSTLSGGQKQRLLLARALYQQPKIIFLDEATSHLDMPLEQHVNAAIKKLCITQIVIAHRLETILAADKIVSFQSGLLIDVTKQMKQQAKVG